MVEIDPEHPGKFRKSRSPYSRWIVGVIAAIPAFVLANLPHELRLMELFRSVRPLKALLWEKDRVSPALPAPSGRSGPLASTQPRLSIGALLAAVSRSPSTAEAEREPRISLARLLRWRDPLAGVPGRPLLALMGRVRVKATTENGPIRPGDLLVSASLPGYAMRCPDPSRCEGAVIGKALEPLEEGTGLIEVLLLR